MGKIQSYGTANSPISGSDKLIGTDSADNNATKNFTISEIQGFIQPYQIYSALLTQSGTGAPTATILQNNIGDIVWTRDDVGVYVGTLSGAFTVGKTFVILTLGGGNVCIVNSMSTGINYVIINSNETDSPNNPIDVDGMMQIEIRVYNS